MKRNFRFDAREALNRAQKELASGDDERLRYAALDLRLAIEALTYDRAQAFASEMPPSEYSTWQPRKLLEVLLEIYPHVDKGSTLRFGEEDSTGKPAGTMHSLGSEKVFDLRAVKKHYDALGSFLHMPTLKQLDGGGGANLSRLRQRCALIVAALDAALASPIFNITLGSFARMDCLECGKPLRRRLPSGGQDTEADCFECAASYRLSAVEGGKVLWEPLQQQIRCPTVDCGHSFPVWVRETKQGAAWQCPTCHQRYRLGLAIFPEESIATSSNGR